MNRVSACLLYFGLCILLMSEVVIVTRPAFTFDLFFGSTVLVVGAYLAGKNYFTRSHDNFALYLSGVIWYAIILFLAVGGKTLLVGSARMASPQMIVYNAIDMLAGILLWLMPPFDNNYHFVPPSERPRPRV